MDNLIRKIVVGTDYKNGMSYSVGQNAYGGHIIEEIYRENGRVYVTISKDNFSKNWKSFPESIVSIENDTEY